MSSLLKLAKDFHNGKQSAEEFSLQFIQQCRKNFTKSSESQSISQAECDIFSACDRFEIDPIESFGEINETQFRQEVAQALKSVGMI